MLVLREQFTRENKNSQKQQTLLLAEKEKQVILRHPSAIINVENFICSLRFFGASTEI
jgi:hypothetical protein